MHTLNEYQNHLNTFTSLSVECVQHFFLNKIYILLLCAFHASTQPFMGLPLFRFRVLGLVCMSFGICDQFGCKQLLLIYRVEVLVF